MQNTLSTTSIQQQIEKTIVQSLVTTFGLDFLLFEDKHGGAVDTIHNARQGVYATEKEQARYANQASYDSTAYHQHANYLERGRNDKAAHQAGNLTDVNRGKTFGRDEKRNTDHVISAKEIHNDPGRVLAEVDGVEIANRDSNLQSTHETINKSKQAKPVVDYLAGLDQQISKDKQKLETLQAQIAAAPANTPQERHNKQVLEDKARKLEDKVEQLESIDREAMLARDQEARAAYEQEIHVAYYTSSKFFKSTGVAAAQAGFKMGARQMLGLVFAEIWFELKEGIPKIYEALKKDFCFATFWREIKLVFEGIVTRVKARFRDFLTAFKDGVFAGVLSSLTTTMFNIFATTGKNAIKMIREVWGHLVTAFKLFFYNPDKLSSAQLGQAICMTLSTAASALVGTWVHGQLTALLTFPFGSECALFLSALTTGLMTLGLGYFFLHSPLMQKLWNFLDKADHTQTLRQYQTVNAQLDAYLQELAKIELQLAPQELEDFALELAAANSELERSAVLRAEIKRRDIDLPFEVGNTQSTAQWLTQLANKR